MDHAYFLCRTPATLIAIALLAMASPQPLRDAQQDEQWHLGRSTAGRVYTTPTAGAAPLVLPANAYGAARDGRPESSIWISRGAKLQPAAPNAAAYEPQEDKTEDVDANRLFRASLFVVLGGFGCLIVVLVSFAMYVLYLALRD